MTLRTGTHCLKIPSWQWWKYAGGLHNEGDKSHWYG